MADSTCGNCGAPLQGRERTFCKYCVDEMKRDDLYEQSGVGPLEPRKAPK